ncbi:MAG: hypothetical protein ACREFH_03135 [Stellaceae bacterium]
MNQDYYALWHFRVGDKGHDYDKLLGIYSTQQKAESAVMLLRGKPGFRDHPDGFEILDGLMNQTGMIDGFITIWGDDELPPQTVWSATERGPKDIPIWTLGEQPRAGENGGEFAWRLMDAHHGPGNWTRDNDEFDQLRKFGNRGNLHPLLNLPSRVRLSRPAPPADQVYYSLWHRRTDPEDYDHDMQLGTYSTREEAKAGRALLADKLGFRDYPDAFEINEGRIDETYETEGFVTVLGEAQRNHDPAAIR